MAKVSDAFRHHHRQLAEEMAQHAAALTDGKAESDPEPLVRFLRNELLPHAASEERSLNPAVEPLLAAHGTATATMRMDHRAIERHVRSLEDLAARWRSAREAARAHARWDLARLVWQLQTSRQLGGSAPVVLRWPYDYRSLGRLVLSWIVTHRSGVRQSPPGGDPRTLSYCQ